MDEFWQSNTNPNPRLQSRINVITLKHFPLARAINVPCSTRLLPLFNLLLSFCLLFHFHYRIIFFQSFTHCIYIAMHCHAAPNQKTSGVVSGINCKLEPWAMFLISRIITLPGLDWVSEWYPWNLDWGIIGFISQWWRSKINSIFDVWSMKLDLAFNYVKPKDWYFVLDLVHLGQD